MGRKIIRLTTDNLRPAAREKAIERVTFADVIYPQDEVAGADEVYLDHQGKILCVKHRGVRRAERADA